MSNTIILKNGEGSPPSLETAELGFDRANEVLYIGDQNKEPIGLFDKRAFSFVDGKMILGGAVYGDEFPPGKPANGQLFFKKVT